ncbi:MAG: AAA family ATPase [Candidatus Eisenbacteria bacterium]|uniref:DNA repair protein RecN n=1 Tax=Eiseniibacteriota bacterium TaxID=2212470 RepID=A0A948RT27_UNCEI|nr:AAA family ATPase [Candidatus Eisenbacteria bacterium]MBU1949612.1 AAA family ATPase [Candidatus Eisenbacteria bacterium]MBU2690360.1 AAA family ATPase [Candidatus Eisenbacteria bacterium]
MSPKADETSAAVRRRRPAPWLEELVIENLVILPEARLTLSPGLNILTGETGTGKSILLEAVALLLGGRGSQNLIRKGCERLRVEGSFRIEKDPAILNLLTEWGFPEEKDQLIIHREIHRDGGSRCTVNNRSLLVGQLSRLGECLAEIHGPWEHQRLLKDEALRQRLDLFGRLHKLLEKVADAAGAWAALRTERGRLESRLEEIARQEDWYRFRVDEIHAAGLKVDERESLGRRLEIARNERSRGELLNLIDQSLEGGDGSVLDILENLNQALSSRTHSAGEPFLNEINDALKSLRDAARSVSRKIRNLAKEFEGPLDETDLDARQEQLDLVERLEKKYKMSWAEILEKKDAMMEDLDLLATGREQIALLQAKEEWEASRYIKAAKKLHAQRLKAAEAMEKALSPHLGDVGWNPSGFRLEIQWKGPAATGIPDGIESAMESVMGSPIGLDRVIGEVETNPGEGWRPFQQVVSHGELSRLHLALLSLQMDQIPPNISIFDEVDMGIGGETARKVAGKLRDLSAHRQVLLVTHLASLASRADRHFHVGKVTQGGRTVAGVNDLNGEQRVEEIARMLAGAGGSRKAREHARELLECAREEGS